MSALKRKSFRSAATAFIALSAMLGTSAHAEAALLGPSSDYIVQISPAARAAVETAIKNSGGTVSSKFQYAFDGFVVKLPDMLLPILKKIPNILTIEKDQPVTGLAIQQNQTPTPSWGLDRTDQREAISTASGYQGSYGYRSAGAGTTIYIGDTGIYPHEDLAGRISSVGFSGIADGNGTVDCNGHGTHVATTAAGTKYGIAKSAKVVPVRILNCAGSGSYATVIAGLDWILSPLNTNAKTQSVLNLSIGGGASSSINDAILRLTNAGVTVVAAAGNDNVDACTKSPASAPSAITVGATTIGDAKAYFSNWGKCVDIHAPGSSITGGWYGSATATNTISGTSMATPHVTGAAAVFLGLNPTASVAQVADALGSQSTKGAVSGLPADTLNNLLYVSPTDGGPAIVPPAVQISTVTGITHLQAQANVEINPNNAPTTARIEYARDAAFTSIIKSINLTPAPLDGGALISLPVIFDGLAPNTSYYFRASAENESGSFTTPVGTFKSLAPPVSAPTVVATAPSALTGWSAHLNGTVNANNGTTTVSFVYGTDPDFLTNTQTGLASQQTVSGNATTVVGLDISFLQPLTKYYVKVIGSNSAASVQSNVFTFTTAAVSGVVAWVETIRPSMGLDTPATTVTGRINPNGQTTSVRLVWDVNASMVVSPKSVTLPTLYTGIDTVTVSALMSGLTPGTRYYYRFEATNAAGESKPVPLTNVGNPLMPVVVNTSGGNQTQTSVDLRTTINAGASNTRISFIWGTTPTLDTNTATINGTPFAITSAANMVVTAALTGLKPNTTYYFRTKILAYTGPLMDKGGIMYGPISSIQTLMPARTAQTITFTLPASRTFIGEPTPLTATASSGLPVTYTTTTPTICQIVSNESGTVLTAATPISPLAGAACVVTASQGGNESYAPAVGIGRTINFLKEAQTITFVTPANKQSSELNPLNITTSSGRIPTVVSTTPATCSIEKLESGGFAAKATSTVSGDGVQCSIQASLAGDDRYAAASAQVRTFTWTRKPQTIAFVAPTSRFYGGAPTVLTATSTSGLPVSIISSTPLVCKVEKNESATVVNYVTPIALTSSSTCILNASQAGDGAWSPATSVMRVMSYMKETTAFRTTFSAPITVEGSALNALVYSASQPTLNEFNAGTTPLAFISRTPNVCKVVDPTYIGSTATHSQATVKALWNGSCQIEVTFVGNGYWLGASTLVSSTITGMTTPQPGANASQSIAFNSLGSYPFGTSVPLTVSATSGLPVTVVSTTPATCSVEKNVNGQYVVTSVDGLVGDTNTCSLQASQAGDTRWAPASNQVRSFKWTRLAQSITFTMPSSRYYGGAATKLTATSTSGLPVTFSTNTPTVCQIDTVDSASVLSYVAPISSSSAAYCYVVASQRGDGKYQAAATLTRSILWQKETTLIKTTWTSAPTIAGSAVDFNVTSAVQPSLNEALAGSTPLLVTSRTPNICLVDSPTYIGTSTSHTRVTVKALWNGTCSLSVSFAGNSYWLPVTSTTSSVISGMVTPQPGANVSQFISISIPTTLEIGASTNIFPSATSKLPVTVTSLTPQVCLVTPNATGYALSTAPGVAGNGVICSLQATQAGNEGWAPAPIFTRTVTVNKAAIALRVLRTASYVTPTLPALMVVGTAHVSGPINNGLNSIGNFLTVITTTPAVCSVSETTPYATNVGVYTQATVKSIANGTCSLTWSFAETATQKAATLIQSLAVTGVK
ncbi:Proteinase K-like catalytic domain [Candidatus Nanopelagicaceae bacterium]